MKRTKVYDQYPAWIVGVCTAVSIAIYVLGAIILYGFSAWASLAYLAGCLWLEIRVLRKSCAHCTYYGQRCGTGKGKLCALLFKQGDPQAFVEKEVTWIDVLPDFMVSLLPLLGGIVLSILAFTWLRIIWMILLAGLAFGGSGVLRGNLLCAHCRQGELGCPAAKLFEKAQG
jgi:hypothetical protein